MKKLSFIVILMWMTGGYIMAATEYYVSCSGNDKNPGTKEKPFATIAHARDSVAKAKGEMAGDIVVYLRGGTYSLSSSVEFGKKDSGTNGHKIVYKAFPGETPIVSGGKVIKGWSLHDKQRNVFKASAGGLRFRQLYVNGVGAVRARYPNMEDRHTLGPYLRGANVTAKKPHQLKVKPAELADWRKWESLNEVEVVMVTHWKQKRARIAGIEGQMISFMAPENTARSMYHLEQPGTPHFYENAYHFLDADGEFYLDTKTDTLYYKPRKGEDLATAKVIVPQVETLFDVKGESPKEMVRNLVFDGITFQYSNWTKPDTAGFQVMQSATWLLTDDNSPIPGAVQLRNASGIDIRSCVVERTGAHGIAAVKDVVSSCSIVGNHVRDIAAGGIYLLLNDETSTGNVITDNTVERIGTYYSNGCGILVARTPDVKIVHNEIRDVRYTAISTGWTWNDKDTAARDHEVAYNLIHGVMRLHDDGGGIYTLGKIPGMNVHDNYVHSVKRSKYSGSYGICAVYLDNGSCLKQVYENVIDNVEAGFFSANKPNYKNTIERNYYNTRLATKIEKGNSVKDNVQIKGSSWPAAAKSIMKKAGPRAPYRISESSAAEK